MFQWKTLSEGTCSSGRSERNGLLIGRDVKVSARPATPLKETAAKGEKGEKMTPAKTEVSRDHVLLVVVLRHFLVDAILLILRLVECVSPMNVRCLLLTLENDEMCSTVCTL